MGQLLGNYCKARKSVREAADAAGTVRERVIKGDDLKVCRRFITFACSLGQVAKRTAAEEQITVAQPSGISGVRPCAGREDSANPF